MLKIKLLKALNGDCIIISYGEEKTHNILIDGGCGKLCYHQLCRYIENMKKEKNIFDLAVLTHIDSDHIEGSAWGIKIPVQRSIISGSLQR